MTIFQIILMVLAINATVYQLVKLVTLGGLVAHHGGAQIKDSFYWALLASIALQSAFIVSITNG